MNVAASTAVIIAASIEEAFKKYLILCEYMQIDPTVVHDIELIKERSDKVVENATNLDEKKRKKLQKDLQWFIKNYSQLTGDNWKSYGFVKNCNKLIKKEQLQILPQTVNEQFEPRELVHTNYDYYAQKQLKPALIALGITIGVLIIIGIVVAVVLL